MVKMQHSELLKKASKTFTGVSGFGFGANWEPPKLEIDEIRKLITHLEDRRVLHITSPDQLYAHSSGSHLKRTEWVAESLLGMREEITHCMQTMQFRPETQSAVENMRRACRTFLDSAPMIVGDLAKKLPNRSSSVTQALGDFRAAMGVEIARLCLIYGFDVEEDLAPLVKFGLEKLQAKNGASL